jgi:hypothetical protein
MAPASGRNFEKAGISRIAGVQISLPAPFFILFIF